MSMNPNVKSEIVNLLELTELSAKGLGKALNIPFNRIYQIINDGRRLTPETAVRLAEFMRKHNDTYSDPLFWLNLQSQDDLLWVTIKKPIKPFKTG